MKLKMKALAAAVALTVAGSANAAIDDFASGDGELFFSVRDNVNKTSYVLDLNIKLSQFNGNANLTFNDMANFVAGSSGDLSWAVMAGDSVGAGSVGGLHYMTTAAAGSDAILGGMNNGTLQNWNAMDAAYLSNVNGVIGTGNSVTSTINDYSYFTPDMDTWSLNSPVSATAGLGQSQNFYLLSNSASTILGKGQLVKVTEMIGTWKLDATTGLTYSAVPVPPALWLLGSALLGLVGVARRKSQNV